MSTVTKLLVASAKIPKAMGNKIIRLQEIVSKLSNNTYFPPGWVAGGVTQAQFTLHVNAFISAETNVRNRLPGAVGARNAAYSTIQSNLMQIIAMVQNTANANISNAQAIIESAGFFVKEFVGSQKKQNAAFNTEIMGAVTLTADGRGHHEWQMSQDQLHVVDLPATTTAQTQVYGLNAGDVWFFRNRKVNSKKTIYNWCNWIQLTIGVGGKNIGSSSGSAHSGSLPAV